MRCSHVMRTAYVHIAYLLVGTVIAAAVSVTLLNVIAHSPWTALTQADNAVLMRTGLTQCACAAGLIGAGWLWHSGRQRPARVGAMVFLSALVVTTLGVPLAGTKLYLFGVSVDQQFRTEYLTRFTDSADLNDMTYTGMPSFYPPGWFWVGGRAAHLTGTPGWEMFKPWAITSLAIAVVVAFVVWSALIRFEHAIAVTTATAAVMLAYASHEPYSAMITMLLPPMLVLAWSGLRTRTRAESSSGWLAAMGVSVFLGVSATLYTLFTAVAALAVTVMAMVLVVTRRSVQPLRRLAIIALVAITTATSTWLPFLLHVLHRPVAGGGSAFHYLPAAGAVLSFPMLQFSLLGAVCLLGTLWLVARARSSATAAALAIGILTIYLWSVLSMLATLARTTLLSFRLQPTLTTLLAAAGTLAFIETAQVITVRARPAWNRALRSAFAALGLVGATVFVLGIPHTLRPEMSVAYTDTDGYGQRADHQPPGIARYYTEIDKQILTATGRPRDQTVVLTAEYGFLAMYPYWGFQGLTPHYANPLAQFSTRAAEIESWADLTTPAQLITHLDALPWPAPTVFLMRHGVGNTYTLRLAKDAYPNQPNVKRYTIELNSALFDSPQFTMSEIGPFVLAIRNLR